MCAALAQATGLVQAFVNRFPRGYPPIIINITDGMANDGDPRAQAGVLMKLAGEDGPVLLFNAHLSSKLSQPILFPAEEASLPDDFARLLFRMSSPLPPKFADAARAEGFPVVAGSRGFVFNADLVSVIRFLDLGTRVSQGVR